MKPKKIKKKKNNTVTCIKAFLPTLGAHGALFRMEYDRVHSCSLERRAIQVSQLGHIAQELSAEPMFAFLLLSKLLGPELGPTWNSFSETILTPYLLPIYPTTSVANLNDEIDIVILPGLGIPPSFKRTLSDNRKKSHTCHST